MNKQTIKILCKSENLFYQGLCSKNNVLFASFTDEKDNWVFRKIYKNKPYDFIKYKGLEYYFA